VERLRHLGLRGTAWARATVGSVRLKLLKVAALVTISVRRIYVQMPAACPYRELFTRCHQHLMTLRADTG
jgi:hypothetical protein